MVAKITPADDVEMQRITAGLSTKSAKIRALAASGYKRADIARFMGIRYQHVRNVLEQPLARRDREAPAQSADSEVTSAREDAAKFAFEPETESVRVYRFHVDTEGRIRLPNEILTALDTVPGGLITGRYHHDELHLMNIAASVRFVQGLAAPFIKEGEGNWSDQLIAERRAEAVRDDVLREKQ